MRLSYVLPDPGSYRDWDEFDGDLACMKRPATTPSSCRLPTRPSSTSRGCGVRWPRPATPCAPSRPARPITAAATAFHGRRRGAAADRRPAARVRRSGGRVEVADRLRLAPGAAQRRARPGRRGRAIRQAVEEIGRYASDQGVTLAFEPVNHGEVGFHNTIAEVAALVREPRSAGPADDGRYLPHEHRREGHARPAGGHSRHPRPRPPLGDQSRRAGGGPLAHGRLPGANLRGSTTAATAPWASTTPAARGARASRSAWRN